MGRFYPAAYFGSDRMLEHPKALRATGYERDKIDLIRDSRKLPPGGRILDVGCGKGEFVANLGDRGWQAQGVELSRIAADYAREKMEIEVFNGELKDAGFPDGHFDLITLWHVLEHCHDPSGVLAETNRILRTEGRLLVSVPNFHSLQARVMKNDWYHLDTPRHLYHFAPVTISKFLEKTGFRILKISYCSPTHNRDGIAFSLLKRYEECKRENRGGFLDREGDKHGDIRSANDFGPLKSVRRKMFDVTVSLLSSFESLIRQGGTMNIYAIKEKS